MILLDREFQASVLQSYQALSTDIDFLSHGGVYTIGNLQYRNGPSALVAHPCNAASCAWWRLRKFISKQATTLTENVVDAAGHPTPGPWRFCKVIMAAWTRAILVGVDWSAASLENVRATPGLLIACPAAALSLNCCNSGEPGQSLTWLFNITCIKSFLSGGQAQGILTIWPCAFFIPSQLPVPSGFTPAWTPNSGTNAAFTNGASRFAYIHETSEEYRKHSQWKY